MFAAVLFAADHAPANPLQPDYVTMGVTLVVFLILLGVLYATAWKPILKGLAAREGAILAARDEARKDAEALKASEKAVGVKEAEAERERAKREIETAKEQALQEIQQTAVQLAALMSSKAVGRSLGEDDHRRLVAESLSELKNSVTRA